MFSYSVLKKQHALGLSREQDKEKKKDELIGQNNVDITLSASVPSLNVTDYQRTFFPCYAYSSELRIAIRSYTCNGESFFVAVDPYSFSTDCLPAVNFSHRKITSDPSKPGYYAKKELDSTPYLTALNTYTAPPYKLQNYGVVQSINPIEGVFLTVDMCPSMKPFEGEFFKKLSSYSDKPTPVAICMTGAWLIKHAEEFKWLLQQEKDNKIKITWVNHSFSHVYYADLVSQLDEENFLLAERVNLNHEITAVEQLLIKNYQCPSVFFRAPGLVTNAKLVKKLNQFGLIPVGSNAWLAKDEEAKNGSIILVHGNSNEPAGIKKIMPLLDQRRFQFLPLAKVFLKEPELKTDQLDSTNCQDEGQALKKRRVDTPS